MYIIFKALSPCFTSPVRSGITTVWNRSITGKVWSRFYAFYGIVTACNQEEIYLKRENDDRSEQKPIIVYTGTSTGVAGHAIPRMNHSPRDATVPFP
jgi:hypothetical protein